MTPERRTDATHRDVKQITSLALHIVEGDRDKPPVAGLFVY